jgi:hypothetical protein
MNITAASLFPGLEGFARSLKEVYDALDSEKLVRNFLLGAVEELGWAP